MKKLRNAFINVMLAMVSIVLTLALLDAGVRMIWRGRPFSIEHRPDVPQLYRFPPGRTITDVITGDQVMKEDPVVQAWKATVVIDAYGFRNESIPDVVDTIVLADSFGSEPVSQEFLIASRLKTCGRSVYNLSVVAHSPWQEYATLILEQDRLNIKPGATLIWMFFSGNDMDDYYMPVYGDAIKTELTHQGPEPYIMNYLSGSPFAIVNRQNQGRVYGPDGGWMLFYEPYLPHARRTADDIRAHPNYPLLRDTIHAMAEEVEERGMKPLVIIAPSKEEVYYYHKASGFGEVVTDLAEENGMPSIDLTPDFLKRAADGEILYLVQDTHWNEYAQQIVSEQICTLLAEN